MEERRGVFLQRDPSGYSDSVNLYAGFANDPVNNRDPSGRIVDVSQLNESERARLRRELRKLTGLGVAEEPYSVHRAGQKVTGTRLVPSGLGVLSLKGSRTARHIFLEAAKLTTPVIAVRSASRTDSGLPVKFGKADQNARSPRASDEPDFPALDFAAGSLFLDFEDFNHVLPGTSDAARESWSPSLVFFHEALHLAGYRGPVGRDACLDNGEVVEIINRIRHQAGLVGRVRYCWRVRGDPPPDRLQFMDESGALHEYIFRESTVSK